MNCILKIPPSLSLLLCTKEGWNSMPMPRLTLPELPHSPKHLSSLPYPWTHWWHERVHLVYQIWHSLGIQQYPHPRRRPMKGCLHYSHGAIWIHCHVLQILQCSSHISSIHEPHLCKHVEGEVAKNLHAWPGNSHQEWRCPPPWGHSISTSMPSRTWVVNQTLQMCIWCPWHGVPGHDYWTGRDQDGWKEAGSHKGMETPHFGQGNLVIHQVCELLQKIHPGLLQHCCPP